MSGSNSTITLDELVDDALSFGNVSPTLATGGLSTSPAISIANTVMQVLINGAPGADGVPASFNWKWNRANMPPFVIISYQQGLLHPRAYKSRLA